MFILYKGKEDVQLVHQGQGEGQEGQGHGAPRRRSPHAWTPFPISARMAQDRVDGVFATRMNLTTFKTKGKGAKKGA